MKRAEQLAWAAAAGLLVIIVILLSGAIIYRFTGFWAGMMLASGQLMVVCLAAWGLMLARQASDLDEIPSLGGRSQTAASGPPLGGFRMSMGDDARVDPESLREPTEVKTLDTGFQRLLVATSGFFLTLLAVISAYLVFRSYSWARLNPDLPLPVAGTFDKPGNMDELGLVIGLAAAAIYGILYWIHRPRASDTDSLADAVLGSFTLGLTGMIALAGATVLGYFRVAWASELAAGIFAFLMLLQGLELLVNAIRSYSAIEEVDQEAVDLQATPFIPMLSSVWLEGLRILFAQSVGLSTHDKSEKGVFARMMPRTLVAIIVIAIGAGCFRVVPPGTVAVLERLGYAPTDDKKHLLPAAILRPGLHLTFPWPIDQLVEIPTEQLQLTNVGTELHAPKQWGKSIDFQFWTVRGGMDENDTEDLFLTGDPSSPQILETYVQVRWRVTQPELFYSVLSHSDFIERSAGEARTLPIYEAIVQQCTSYAVTRSFAIHSLEQIMIGDRREVEEHCREILQQKLDSLGQALGLSGSGINVDYLTIKDLHPPYWQADRYDPNEPRIGGVPIFTDTGIEIREDQNNRSHVRRGPASAFEFVISMREFRQVLIDLARAESTVNVTRAQGFADSETTSAEADRLDKIARAHGEADRLLKMTENMDPKQQQYLLQLMEQRQLYVTLKDLLDPVTKIIVDPQVRNLEILQNSEQGLIPAPGVISR